MKSTCRTCMERLDRLPSGDPQITQAVREMLKDEGAVLASLDNFEISVLLYKHGRMPYPPYPSDVRAALEVVGAEYG